MKSHKGVAVLVVAVILLGGVMFYRNAREAERKARQEREELARSAEKLQRQIQDMKRRADDADRALRAAQGEAGRWKAEAEAKPKPAPEVETKPSPAAMAEAVPAPGAESPVDILGPRIMDNIMNRPQGREAARSSLLGIYEDFFKSRGLEGESRERILNALVNRRLWFSKNLEPGKMTFESIASLKNANQNDDASMAGLSQQEKDDLNEYEKELHDKQMSHGIDREIASLDIDPSRAPILHDIMMDERKREEGIVSQGLANPSVAHREANERILQRARPVLTAEEYERLRQHLQMPF